MRELEPEQARQADCGLRDLGLREGSHPTLLLLAAQILVGVVIDQATHRTDADFLKPAVCVCNQVSRPIEALDERARHVHALRALPGEKETDFGLLRSRRQRYASIWHDKGSAIASVRFLNRTD